MKENNPIGLTKDVGFEVGVRRTLSAKLNEAWDFLLSKKGLNIWLGSIDPSVLILNEPFTVPGKAKAMITVLKPYSHLRMKWQPLTCKNFTTLQIRVIPNEDKSTISVHLEQLNNEHQRNMMQTRWKSVLDELVSEFETN